MGVDGLAIVDDDVAQQHAEGPGRRDATRPRKRLVQKLVEVQSAEDVIDQGKSADPSAIQL
jgi:hypothetical protein